jgi:hypothetical protein
MTILFRGGPLPGSLAMIILLTLVLVIGLPCGSTADDTALAHKLLNSQGCKACHALKGDGGKEAGSFEEIGQRLSWAEIRLQLVNPEGAHANGKMSDFSHLSEKEIEALIYLIKPVQ